MSYCQMEAIELSDLDMHTKALECLIAYYETEQYNPHNEAQHVLTTYASLAIELRALRQHLVYSHVYDDAWDLKELINRLLDELDSNERVLKKMYYGRAQQGDS